MIIKRSIKKIIFSAVLSLILQSCATAYSVKQNGPQAKLGFKDNNPGSNENIGKVFADYKTCKIGKEIPIFGAPMAINADQLVTILVGHTVSYMQVNFAATFYAQAGHTYLIATDGNKSKNNVITMRILDQLDVNTNKPVPFVKREYKLGTYAESTCADVGIDFASSKKVYSMQQTAKNDLLPTPVFGKESPIIIN